MFKLCYFSQCLQCCLEPYDEVVGICLSDAERWKKTEYVCSTTACKAMLLLDEACTYLLVWYVKLDTNHESLTTYIHYVWETL